MLAVRLTRAPTALRASVALRACAPFRQMSSGSTGPGSIRWPSILYVASGLASIGGLYYAYGLVTSSRDRYNERLHLIEEARERGLKAYSQTKSNEEDSAEVAEAKEETAAVAAEEVEAALADGPTEQEVAMETEGEKELPGADASLAVEAAQQEAAASLEAASMQETAGDVLDAAAASAHEEKLENLQEEIDSSAQERPGASPTNQGTVAEGSGQASEVSTGRQASEDVSKDS